jgi:hypothetical protein
LNIDFVALCRTYHIPYAESGHHHCHEGWVQTHCPFCAGGQEGFHLGYSLERGTFHCWRCGSHNFAEVMRQLLHVGENKLAYRIAGKFKLGPRTSQERHLAPRKRKHTCPPPPGITSLLPQHKRYLRGRRFNPRQLQQEWGIMGTAHTSGIWAWRIIIPVREIDGHICAYQGRVIREDVDPRYRFTPNKDMTVDPKTLLYGIEKVRGDAVVIVEGATDVWRLGPGAVATVGIGWHPEQADILRHYDRRYILFDPEPVARKRAIQLAQWLSPFQGTTEIIDTTFEGDPGSYTDNDAASVMRELAVGKYCPK